MAGLSDAGTVVFFEVKLFENNEIRSMKTPKVVGQLKKYARLSKKVHDPVRNGYQQQMETYSLLKGRFFQKRFRKVPKLAIRPDVRLVVTGFDASQRKYLLPVIREKILAEMEWTPNTPELIACGNVRSIKKNHLFKGIL